MKIRKFLSIAAQLSSIVGSVISLFPAIPLGRLHYRVLEREKISLLRKAGGNFDVKINSLNEFVKDELNWWLESIPKAMADILLPVRHFSPIRKNSSCWLNSIDRQNVFFPIRRNSPDQVK